MIFDIFKAVFLFGLEFGWFGSDQLLLLLL